MGAHFESLARCLLYTYYIKKVEKKRLCYISDVCNWRAEDEVRLREKWVVNERHEQRSGQGSDYHESDPHPSSETRNVLSSTNLFSVLGTRVGRR